MIIKYTFVLCCVNTAYSCIFKLHRSSAFAYFCELKRWMNTDDSLYFSSSVESVLKVDLRNIPVKYSCSQFTESYFAMKFFIFVSKDSSRLT